MKIIKYILLGLLSLIILVVLYLRFAVHETRPVVIQGQNPEGWADKMFEAVDKEAWDTLAYISWSFRDHHYVWDRTKNDALVKWDNIEVHLDPDNVDGLVIKDGATIVDGKSDYIQKAWSYWCNDMFWLSAPFKIRDTGTKRELAKDKDGNEGLLVSYDSGGVTPGDSYLWYLDENGRPTGYKMWVSIIPVGGVYTSWENWTHIEGGSQISTLHQGSISALRITIDNLKAGDEWSDLGYQSSPIKL